MAKSLTKDELKQPDEFITLGMRFYEWGQKNIALVVILALAPLVIAGALFAMNQKKQETELSAGSKLYVGEKKLEGVSQFKGFKIPGMNTSTPEDQKAALAIFIDVAKSYPGTKAARRAHLLAGDTALELADYDTAAAEYVQVTDGTPLERFYAASGRAAALEGKGSYDDAAMALRAVLDDTTMLNRDIATLDLARILVAANKTDDAKALLAKFGQDFPSSSLKTDADSRLVALGGTPVPATTPAIDPN